MVFAGAGSGAESASSLAGAGRGASTAQLSAPSPYNTPAWNKLEDASGGGAIAAVLVEFDINGNEEKPAWEFLINPAVLQYQNRANYTAVSPHASPAPNYHFNHTEGASLTIPGMLMRTFCMGKSLRSLLQGLEELLKAKPSEDQFAPKLLTFRWGSKRFPDNGNPCFVEEVSWTESQWIGGEPAGVAELSITLKEVQKPLTQAEKEEEERLRAEALANIREQQSLPREPLTERQQEEGRAIAQQYLDSELGEWTDEIQAAVSGDRFLLRTDANTGDVYMVGANGADLGIIGRYDGRVFRGGGDRTTIPTKAGEPRPEVEVSGRDAVSDMVETGEMM